MKVVKFETKYEPAKEQGQGLRAVDWVELAPSGSAYEKTRTRMRVSDCMPPEHLRDLGDAQIQQLSDFEMRLALRWNIIGPAYAAWKRSEALPETGTPLAAWPGVTKAQADVLKKMGITTVEEVRDIDDQSLSVLNWPNARKLPEMAAAYLSGQDGAAKDAELAEMRERMLAMEDMLEEQMAQPKLTKDGKVDGRTKAARAAREDAA
jgi:hypothetical protein